MKNVFLQLFLFLLLLPLVGQAQRGSDGSPPVTTTYAIKNASVTTQPGTVIEMGTVLIRDGLIEAVGKDIKIPADAKVIDGDSMYVYAGFIEGLSHTAVPKPKQEGGEGGGERGRPPRAEGGDPGNPSNEEAGIQPERDVLSMLVPTDKSVETMRNLGFTAAHVVPQGKMLPGKGAIILLAGDSPDAMLLRNGTSLFSQYDGAGRVYPSTVMAVMSKWRELYKQAEQTKGQEAQYSKTPRGMMRPQQDRVLEAFYPVIEKQQSVFFVADGVKPIYRTLTLQKELGFPLVLAEVKQGWHVVKELKALNRPILLSMDLPEDKSAKKADAKEKKEGEAKEPTEAKEEKKDEEADKKKEPEKKKDPETLKLEERRDAELKEHEMQAATLAKAGIRFGFSSLEVKDKDIRENLRRMIKAGLTEDQALAALTTVPADMLGVSDILGTVEKGKIANLVVSDKPYFAEESNVRYVFVDGQLFEQEVKKKKKGDPTAVVSALGTWSYKVEVPGQTTTGTLTITGELGNLTGTMTDDEGNVRDLNDVTLDGNTLIFTSKFDAGGQDVQLDFELVIDGETLEGSVGVGAFGTFDVSGERTSKPD